MNAAVLIIGAIVVCALGYRFYAKFLGLAVFGPAHTADPRTSQQTGPGPDVTPGVWVTLIHHLAVVCGGTTIIGAVIAAVWGWAPAFLWITTGTVVAAGTYVVGNLWLGREMRGGSPGGILGSIMGKRAAVVFYVLSWMLLVVLSAFAAVLIGEILGAYPAATWAFLLQLPIAVVIARSLKRSAWVSIVLSTIICLTMVCALLAFGLQVPLAITGFFDLVVRDRSLPILEGEFVWTLCALLFAYLAVRVEPDDVGRARGFLSGLSLLIGLALLLAAILFTHPEVVAPAYQTSSDLPSPIPMLFLAVTGGALAGFHALILSSTGANRLDRKHANIAGYGGAVTDGLLGLAALVVATAGFADVAEWEQVYLGWPESVTLQHWAVLFIDGFARFAAALGIPANWGLAFAAYWVSALALSTLVATLQGQCVLIREIGEGLSWQPLLQSRWQTGPTLVAVTLVAIWLAAGQGWLNIWLLLGGLNQMVASAMLLVLSIAMAHLHRPWVMTAAPLVIVLTAGIWGLVLLSIQCWVEGRWLASGFAVVVLALGLWLSGEGAHSVYRHLYRRSRVESSVH